MKILGSLLHYTLPVLLLCSEMTVPLSTTLLTGTPAAVYSSFLENYAFFTEPKVSRFWKNEELNYT